MPTPSFSSLRPLNLQRRKSGEATAPAPEPPPPMPQVTPPSEAGSLSTMESFSIETAQRTRPPYLGVAEPNMPVVRMSSSPEGAPTLLSPTPKPPFRLLAPSIMALPRSTSPEAPRPLSLYSEAARPGDVHETETSLTPMPPHRPYVALPMNNDRRLQMELRGRPLHESLYGRHIVQLLTMVWYVAPSGLWATVYPPGTPDDDIINVASYINLLMCGTEAFKQPQAGILAIYSPHQLNKLLVRSGLSPIVPQPCPTHWPPLAARQPPDFLTDGFRPRPGLHPYDQEG